MIFQNLFDIFWSIFFENFPFSLISEFGLFLKLVMAKFGIFSFFETWQPWRWEKESGEIPIYKQFISYKLWRFEVSACSPMICPLEIQKGFFEDRTSNHFQCILCDFQLNAHGHKIISIARSSISSKLRLYMWNNLKQMSKTEEQN
jgi:hypothetical protein